MKNTDTVMHLDSDETMSYDKVRFKTSETYLEGIKLCGAKRGFDEVTTTDSNSHVAAATNSSYADYRRATDSSYADYSRQHN